LYANLAVGAGIRLVGGRAAGAAVSRGLGKLLGPTAGGIISCIGIGYCSFDDIAPENDGVTDTGLSDEAANDDFCSDDPEEDDCKQRYRNLKNLWLGIKEAEKQGMDRLVLYRVKEKYMEEREEFIKRCRKKGWGDPPAVNLFGPTGS
jgi:hypothetical protein